MIERSNRKANEGKDDLSLVRLSLTGVWRDKNVRTVHTVLQ